VRFCAVDGPRDGPTGAQKNERQPWQAKQWCLPEGSAACVAALADVRALDEEPYAPQRPQGNFDETSKPLMAETRGPRPANPGQPALYASAYQRHGTRPLFVVCAPPAGWRQRAVTAHRTMQAFAPQRPWLVAERSPEAARLRGVLENRHTHKPASLYAAFEPGEARRLLKKLAWHYTPKHGSWLHRADSEWRI